MPKDKFSKVRELPLFPWLLKFNPKATVVLRYSFSRARELPSLTTSVPSGHEATSGI